MAFPPKVKEAALVACGRTCCICHRFCGLKMELHHIEQVAENGEDTFENCIPLCFDCHADMRSYDSAHPKGTKYTPGELRAHRDRWYARANVLAPPGVGETQPATPVSALKPEKSADRGYHLAEGHSLTRGTLGHPLTPPPSRCTARFQCVERIESATQLQQESARFAVDSEDLREAIATAAGCQPYDVGQAWSMIVGSPRTHLVVVLLDGQFVVLKIADDGRSFAAIDLAPTFPSPPRCDTRAAATVDVLQNGEGQLLLASDGLAGSGLGQTLVAIYRVEGSHLACIFEEEINFNLWLDVDGIAIAERSTTIHWARGYGSAVQPRILAITTRTLGDVRSVRAVEFEWDGTIFRPANHAQDAVAAKEEQVRFEDEEARLQQAGRQGSS